MRDQYTDHRTPSPALDDLVATLLLATLFTATLFCVASCPASGQVATTPATARQSPASELPDPQLTPGAVRASASLPGCPTDYTTDGLLHVPHGCPGPVTIPEVCATHGTRQFRRTAGVTKRSVCAAYGISAADCPGYEDDHLIPLELGGSDARENHWPQPWGSEWDAGRKDWLENELRRLVCGGALPIERAWRCVAEEWTKCWVQAKAGEYAKMGVE